MTQATADAAHCDALLREADPDRWLAGLFLREPEREAVTALYAFNIEIARIRDLVSQPLPGEVRLQWWRDLVDGDARGDVAAHPVAASLMTAVRRHALPLPALAGVIDARVHDLYDDLFATVGDLEAYCGATSSVLLRLATLILAGGTEPGSVDAAGHAGVAYGIVGLLRAVPHHALRGRVIIPLDVMERNGATSQMVLSGQRTPRSPRRWPRCGAWPGATTPRRPG